MRTPLLLVNLKTYKEGLGKGALKIEQAAFKASKKTGVNVGLAVQAVDLRLVKRVPLFSQHIDSAGFGTHTGFITPEAVKDSGAHGTLINHAEHKISLKEIELGIKRAHEVGLEVIACAKDLNEAKSIAGLKEKPEFIAYEPPELIGGNISVSTAKPEVLEEVVKEIMKIDRKINILCGAGIKDYNDALVAKKLGTKGLLVASGIVEAENTEKAIIELCNGLK